MSKVIKSTDGKYYLVHDFEEVSAQEVQSHIAHAQQELADLEAIAPAAEQPQVPEVQPEEVTLPAPEPTPAVVEPAPAAEQPAASPETSVDPVPVPVDLQ